MPHDLEDGSKLKLGYGIQFISIEAKLRPFVGYFNFGYDGGSNITVLFLSKKSQAARYLS